jgi:heme exporter protein C
MLKNWWKILSIFILIYVSVFGMLIPLKPAIQKVSKITAKSGDTLELVMFGYNTFFKSATDARCWLKFDSAHVVEGHSIRLINDREMSATFAIPKFLPTKSISNKATLIVSTDADGSFPLPSAVFVTQDSINTSLAVFPDKINNLHHTSHINFPYRNVLEESIRCLYFHVPLWFGMMILFGISVYHSIMYLRNKKIMHDLKASALVNVGLAYGILGLITGAIWAKHTWLAYWSFDVKQNMAAICVMIYFVYVILRYSFTSEEVVARISSVWNIFSFVAMFPLLFIIPRLVDSLHPGNGGNPGLGSQDLDNTMRLVFYPAVIGFTLLGYWMAQIDWRAKILRRKILNYE